MKPVHSTPDITNASRMKLPALLTLLLGLGAAVQAADPRPAAPTYRNLAGVWEFALDQNDVGEREGWQDRRLEDSMELPGSTDERGKGTPLGPERAQAGRLTRAFVYEGAAWYRREIEIPAEWKDRSLQVFLERAHWETSLWIDGRKIGVQNSLSAPQVFDVEALPPGKHTMALRIDNRLKINVGEWAHSVTDETMGNWNGVIGRMEIRALGLARFEGVRIGSDLQKDLRIKGRALGAVPKGAVASIRIRETAASGVLLSGKADIAQDGSFQVGLPLGGKLKLWDEFQPQMYVATLEASGAGGKVVAREDVPFGVREMGAKGRQFTINGRETFMCGNLICGEFPLTGHFPMDEAGWERVFRIAKDYGLNHMRLHSFCPPEAAFRAADKIGFYLAPEGPFWSHPERGTPEGDFLKAEAMRMIEAYGNHPSFTMMGLGNELGGGETNNAFYSEILRELRAADPRRLYTCDVNDPDTGKRRAPIADTDYFVTHTTEKQRIRLGAAGRFVNPIPDSGTDYDYSLAAATINQPLVSHEMGHWVTHPSGVEISKYTGVMKPHNLAFYRRLLDLRGMGGDAEKISLASGKCSGLFYKEDIETCLRTPGFGGFHLLSLQDYPGTGDALVGILDAFWESKGIYSGEEFRRFCAPVVVLARMPRFVLTNNEDFIAKLEVANYGPADLQGKRLKWTLRSVSGVWQREGSTAPADFPTGGVSAAGEVKVPLAEIKSASALKLEVSLEGSDATNDWMTWVYPPQIPPEPQEVLVARDWNEQTRAHLAKGGSVLLSVPGKARGKNDYPQIISAKFAPVSWSFVWRSDRGPSTLGLLCDPAHPALAQFPTDFHSNWQWAELLNDSHAFILNDLPENYRPIVQAIDDFHRAYRLGHVFEGRVGKGRIIISGVDLHTALDRRPVARQLRHSLLNYMQGDQFHPVQDLPVDRFFQRANASLTKVLLATSAMAESARKSKTEVVQAEDTAAIEEKAGADKKPANLRAAAAIDANWTTDWIVDARQLPQEIQLDLGEDRIVQGMLYKPSRKDLGLGCVISAIEVYASNDPKNWGEPAVRFRLPVKYPRSTYSNPRNFYSILLDRPRSARYLRVVISEVIGPSRTIRIAEFEPLLGPLPRTATKLNFVAPHCGVQVATTKARTP